MKQIPEHMESMLNRPIDRRGFLKAAGGIVGLTVLSSFTGGTIGSAKEEEFAFAVLADTHIDPNSPKHSGNLSRIFTDLTDGQKPAFILHVGDVVESGFQEEYQEYARLVPSTLKDLIHAVPGNHEARWDEWGKEFYTQMFGTGNYSFDRGGVHVIALDPTSLLQEGGYFDPIQLEWLRSDLQKTGKKTPIVIYLHYPIGKNFYYISNQEDFFSIVEPYNVRAVFTGHIHREEVWKQNGITIISLPGIKDAPIYHWVEKKSLPLQPSVLAVYHAEFTSGALSDKKLLVEIPLSGEKPAENEKPQQVHLDESASEPVLSVKLHPHARAVSVRYQFWPDVTYAGSNNGSWKELLPTGQGNRFETVVDTAGLAPGVYRIQVRVTNEAGEFWDEVADMEIPAAGSPAAVSRIEWEHKLDASVQAGVVIAQENTAIVSQLDGTVTALELSAKGAQRKWAYRTQGAIIGTPALNADGSRVYLGSADHRVYALNTADGRPVWSYGGAQPVLSSPLWIDASHDGKESVIVAVGRTLLKLDAATGAVLWTANIGGFFAGRPEVLNGAVFVAAGDGKAYALDIRTGALLWQKTLFTHASPYRTLLYSPWYCNPTILPDKQSVLFSTVSNAIALNGATGNNVWTLKGGYMYSGYSVQVPGPEPLLVLPDEWGATTAVNPANGSVRWTNKTKQRIFHAAPVLHEGIVYLASVNGLLTGLDAVTGNVVEELQFSTNYVFSSPAVSNGRLIAAGHDGIVRGIRLG
ncbi:outer membrane protein assembly factor BamB family protein [Paenibacillus spongiae]|uniref:PQQ-binding-like beta-propeller repeat protein n=1 Tax=Paenibacillus spongiae TaxID=2909671 RepID=A0ABY5S4H5_9BACL|nr:PQQ-binding-like beta-propeller repeat protein [Paenibacillus spongiae]UVI27745.1 PQQ-binding-like beta-propeller repeat protein [Paenibacillus spongiae]